MAHPEHNSLRHRLMQVPLRQCDLLFTKPNHKYIKLSTHATAHTVGSAQDQSDRGDGKLFPVPMRNTTHPNAFQVGVGGKKYSTIPGQHVKSDQWDSGVKQAVKMGFWVWSLHRNMAKWTSHL